MNTLFSVESSKSQCLKRIFLLPILILVILAGCKSTKVVEVETPEEENPEETIVQKFSDADWEIENVSEAVAWRYHHFHNLYSSNQSLTVIEVNLNKNPEISFSYVESGFLKTSEAATDANAIAAINGSFFDTSEGGSAVFFKNDGEIIAHTRDGFTSFRENSGFAVSEAGKVSVIKRPTAGWESVEVENLLVSGPLLVYNGEIMEQLEEDFNTTRHPRTAICVTESNRLLGVVVDGRSKEAHGMTTEELALVMKFLECEEAMNLDGGGSSTAWIKNYGVVNYPSDNKQFDHEGERGVATVITFGLGNN